MRNYLKHLGESQPIHRFTILESTYWMLLDFIHDSTALMGLGLMGEISRSHSDTPQSVGLLSTTYRAVAETSTW